MTVKELVSGYDEEKIEIWDTKRYICKYKENSKYSECEVESWGMSYEETYCGNGTPLTLIITIYNE